MIIKSSLEYSEHDLKEVNLTFSPNDFWGRTDHMAFKGILKYSSSEILIIREKPLFTNMKVFQVCFDEQCEDNGIYKRLNLVQSSRPQIVREYLYFDTIEPKSNYNVKVVLFFNNEEEASLLYNYIVSKC